MNKPFTARELKFRAWHFPNQKMLEPNIVPVGVKNMKSGRDWHYMQFTGLRDKNGVEIYEGDIVVSRDISGSGSPRDFGPRLVRWFSDSCNFNVTRPIGNAEIEVIGNVFETPHLLEVENV